LPALIRRWTRGDGPHVSQGSEVDGHPGQQKHLGDLEGRELDGPAGAFRHHGTL